MASIRVFLQATVAVICLNAMCAQAYAGGFQNLENGRAFPWIDEVRLGLFIHDSEQGNDEDGADLNLEILYGRIGHARGNFLDYFLMPRPHLGATISFKDTSLAYAGFTWDLQITERLFVETSFGGAVHNGPFDDKDDAAFGCAANFRESASLGVALSDRWRMLATIEHMSNAGLCGENDGLTNAGVRLGYKW